MSRARTNPAERRPAARRLASGTALLALGLLLACQTPGKPGTEVPDGPSEAAEVPSAVIEAGMAEGADEAAKQAAAQEVLKKVKDRDPEEEKKKLARSRAVSAEARGKLDRGLQAEALQTARDALKIHEQNVDAMLVIAEAYYKQGKYELVQVVTTSALAVDAKIRTPEETSRAYNLQGFALIGLGEEIQATQAFKTAAEVDEKNAAAWNNLGTRYLAAGDIATAVLCFQYALELDPRFPQAHLNYGAALRAQSKWEEAETEIRKALELRPNYAEAYFTLGVLYLDADPFPGLDTTTRLNKAIQSLGKYRELAIADGGARPGKKGPGIGGDGKAPPPPVSKERADDYIRVAKKGIEREERRLEREKSKPAGGGDPAAGGGEPAAGGDPAVAGDPAVGGDAGPTSPDDGATEPPATEPPGTEPPAPQAPGTEPSKPAPQAPGTEPSKPAPQAPGTEPSKPAPQGPSTPAPSKPTPQGPTSPAPTPVQPTPVQPTPVKPAPQGPTPTPVKPAPQAPTSPAAPAPQQPGVQKPQSAALQGSPFEPFENLASRGTRSIPSTLKSMAGGAPVPPRVHVAVVRPIPSAAAPSPAVAGPVPVTAATDEATPRTSRV